MSALSLLRSFRQQNLLIEFASLKHVQLQGVYLSLSQNNPLVWTGTLFLRRGQYAPAVFRFRVSFPSDYPFAPPVITFGADIFHPLLTPLTTYTYTASSEGHINDSARDEKLPPGAFSLRHGFPEWFTKIKGNVDTSTFATLEDGKDEAPVRPEDNKYPTIVEVIKYVRGSFENELFLDALPFEAVANPSAWYAWQSYRGRSRRPQLTSSQHQAGSPNTQADDGGSTVPNDSSKEPNASRTPQSRPKHPSEWNWEGVWVERVQRAVQSSLNEQSLFGSGAVKDDDIQFSELNDEEKENIQAELHAYSNAI